MASNPLLALLNFSGSTSPPAIDSNTNNGNGGEQSAQQNSLLSSILGSSSSSASPPLVENSNSTSANAANSLLQSLLRPSPQEVTTTKSPQHTQLSSENDEGRISSPAAKDGAAELLALLGGGGSMVGLNSNLSNALGATSVKEQNRVENDIQARSRDQFSPLPLNTKKSQNLPPRTPSSTIFDQVSPFDLLNSPQVKSPPVQPQGIVQPSFYHIKMESPSIDSTAQRASSRASEKSNWSKELPTFTNNPQLHAINQMSSLRASGGLDDELSSGLTIREIDGNCREDILDLSSMQPAGKSSIYPAKLELTAISILKGPREPPRITSDASISSICGRWPLQNIVAGANDILCYVTGKLKVRIIDEKTGERAMIYADGAIRSIFLNDDTISDKSEILLGVMTEKTVQVWTLTEDFGGNDGGVKLVTRIGAEEDSSFLQASFVRGKKANSGNKYTILSVQSNGKSTSLYRSDLTCLEDGSNKTINNVLSTSKAEVRNVVAYAQSFDGSLAALVYATSDMTKPLELHLRSVKNDENVEHIRLSGLPNDVKIEEIDFAALVSDGESTRSLLLGFNSNTVLAFVDLITGVCRQVYRFDGKEYSQFNVVQWSHEKRTLFVFNSLRSSLFTLKPFQKPSSMPSIKGRDDAMRTLERIRTKESSLWTFDDSTPIMRECALPEVWMSFYIDDLYEWDGVRMTALYTGGIQSIILPTEAMQQKVMSKPAIEYEGVNSVVIDENIGVTTQDDIKPISKIIETNKAEQSADTSTSHLDIESLRETLSVLERNIISSISASSSKSTAESITSSKSSAVPQQNGSLLNTDQISESIVNRLIPRLADQINSSIGKEISQTVMQVVNKSLPNEIQNAFLRPDLNAHLTRSITNSIIPAVQKTAMDVVTRAMAPHFEEVIGELTAKVEAKVEQGMVNVRKDIVVEQSKALLGSEAAIRDLTRQMGQLTSMMEGLSRQNVKLERALNDVKEEQKVLSLNSIRPPTSSGHQTRSSRSISQAPITSNNSFGASVANVPQQQTQQQTPQRSNQPDVEDTLLTALSIPTVDQDPRPLRNALSNLESSYGSAFNSLRSSDGRSKISQAVNLALLHKLIKINGLLISEPEKIVPWIEACCSIIDRSNSQIARIFDGVRSELLDEILTYHHQLYQITHQTSWWTGERLNDGILRYIA